MKAPTAAGPRTDTACPGRHTARPALLLCSLILAVLPAYAQEADSTQVQPDSLLARLDSLPPPPGPPTGFAPAEPGLVLGDTIPALSPAADVPSLLAAVPGAFVYEFGAIGWPDGWSPYGLNPQRVGLSLNGLPFDDLVTGRPRYDLLPVALLEPLGLQAGRYGVPFTVHARLRAFDVQEPLTEMRYFSSNTGLQSITALHTQQRSRRLFGRDGVAGFVFGYGGQASAGEYPGGRLRRARQLLARLRYAQAGWSIELMNLHNRRQLGAHGGVLPQAGFAFESVYTRIGASVEDPNARRQTIRNDLAATLRRRVGGLDEPLTASVYWTAQTFRYRNPGADTLAAKTHRYGVRVQQDLRLGRHRFGVYVDGWTDRLRGGEAVPDVLGRSRSRLHATARDAWSAGPLAMALEGGLHVAEYGMFPGGSAEAAFAAGPLRLFADAASTGQPVSWVEARGFGRFVRPVGPEPTGRVTRGRAGLTLRGGPFDLTVFGFAHTVTQPLDLYETAVPDSVVALTADAPFRRAGLGGDFGWRRSASRGLYVVVRPTLVRFLNADASELHARQEAALPAVFAQGRLGVRTLLFTGDLDLDAGLEGRAWSALRSRTLHPQTGLLVVPAADARRFDASGTLDLVVSAGIRTATLFVAYENILSGTQLLLGNLLVPVYPLPERRLRFGVYWPMKG